MHPENTPLIMHYQDYRIGSPGDRDSGEQLACSTSCAYEHMTDRGMDPAASFDIGRAGHMAFVPHMSKQDGYGVSLIRMRNAKEIERLRGMGARCAQCRQPI